MNLNSSNPERVLAHRPFVFFLLARLAATIAFQMQVVAIGWQMYSLTDSALDLGLIGLVQFVPGAVLVLIIGQVADHFDRRYIACICQLVAAIGLAILAFSSASGWITRGAIFIFVFLLALVRAFEAPALQALVPSLVPDSMLSRAIAWSSSTHELATISGPAIGGLLYLAGADVVYGTSAGLFLSSALLLSFVHLESTIRKNAPVTMQSLIAGFSFVKRHPVLLGAISLDMMATLLGGSAALLPIIARDILHTGPWGLGLLRSASAAGALLIALYLAKSPLESGIGRLLFISVAVYGISTIAFGLSPTLWWAITSLLVVGASDMISVVIRSSLIQLETPKDMRGRVSAVNFTFIGASNQLGQFESGVTAAWFGVIPSVLIGGVGTLLVTMLWMHWFPQLIKRNRLRNHEDAIKLLPDQIT